jgi:hypothetical protein
MFLYANITMQLEPTFSALLGVRAMVFHVTFNKIAIISWRSVLWVDETEILGENHRPVASLTNFITYCCIEYTSLERDSNSQR